ncbi:MAG TPA: addiction module protein [Chthoniobacteraceae bacterium]|jgi:putative addiction module component (TIGR02574 family)|nr:addiction module protein [Chthoniobacteraceae bacterium]
MSSLAEIESAVDGLPLPEQEELLQRLARKLGGLGAEDFPVREDHLRLLDERFAAYRDDPQQASTWEEVKRRFADRRP